MKKFTLITFLLAAISLTCFADEAKSAPKFIQALEKGTPQQVIVYGTSLTKGSKKFVGGPWVIQLKELLDKNYPGLVTLTNEGKGGTNSTWGLANIDRVIKRNPKANVIFIEFAINDAVTRFHQSPGQTRENLEGILTALRRDLPFCEIILQITHPAIGVPQESRSARSNQDAHQQVYRDLAQKYNLLLIDNVPAVMDYVQKNGEQAFKANYAGDGVHINLKGVHALFRPALVKALQLKQN